MGSMVGFVAGAFAELVGWFAKRFGERVAVFGAAVTAITVLYGTMVVVVGVALNSVSIGLPAWVVNAAGIFLPSDVGAAMAVVMTARVARWVYDANVAMTKLWTVSS